MSSQFDSLLDFGDSKPKENGTSSQSDAFDPFGASPSHTAKGGAGGDLLGNFSFDGSFTTNSDEAPLGINTSDSFNPLYELANSAFSGSSLNPLYDMADQVDNGVPSEQTQDIPQKSSGSTNPLYELQYGATLEQEDQGTGASDQSNDLLAGDQSNDLSKGDLKKDLLSYDQPNDTEDQSNGVLSADQNELVSVDQTNGHLEQSQQDDSLVSFEQPAMAEEQLLQPDVTNETEAGVNDAVEENGEGDAAADVQDSEPMELLGNGDSDPSVNYTEEQMLRNDEEPHLKTEEQAVDGETEGQTNENLACTGENVPENETDAADYTQEFSEFQADESSPEVESYQYQEQSQVAADDFTSTMSQEVQNQEATAEDKDIEEDLPAECELTEEVENVPEVCEAVDQTVDDKVQEAPAMSEEDNRNFLVESEQSQEVSCVPQADEALDDVIQRTSDQTYEEEESALNEEVTYKSTSFICLSPRSPLTPEEGQTITMRDEMSIESNTPKKESVAPAGKEEKVTKKAEAPKEEEKTPQQTKPVATETSAVVENGFVGNEAAKETKEKEEIHFDEMSNIKTKFETYKGNAVTSKVDVKQEILSGEGGEYENQPEKFEQWQNTTEGGVFENTPTENPDVVKESIKNIGEELPEVGMAKNMLQKFKQIQESTTSYTPHTKRQLTPDRTGKVEYVSEPRAVMEKPQQVVQAGVFESNPAIPKDVVRSGDHMEESMPETGQAKNLLAKFKEYEAQAKNAPAPSPRREITPDRNTKGEYVSEPRTKFEAYQNPVESGEFENQPQYVGEVVRSGDAREEVLPEKGSALNLVSRFKEYEKGASSPPVPHTKREITPDRSGKYEYVSEPRGTHEKYEGKPESGVFESSPQFVGEVVKSDQKQEEAMPEVGMARNVAARFKELEKTGSSPSSTPTRKKEFTPPREDDRKGTRAGVLENEPVYNPDVVRSSDVMESELPERGMTKNILHRFSELQSKTPESPRQKKEFTPPPDSSGVYENNPQPSLQIEVRQAESGILESTPQTIDGIAREHQNEQETVFPEAGYAKNMVNRWKQIETKSGESTPSPRKHKEFTPPRDFRGPLSPKSPAGMDSSVQPSDLPGQYQEQVSAGVFENNPEKREGVFRESESNWEEELPAKDTTKSLLQHFKTVQASAKQAEETPKPKPRKESVEKSPSPEVETPKMFQEESSDEPGKRGSFVPVNLEKCAACQKTVYALEKMEINGAAYHKACFRCSQCKTTLTPKSFSINEGTVYCTNHFKQLFKLKGNYDEGFGRHQYKKRWAEEHSKQNSQAADVNGQ